jgi:hypothetical protein
VVISPNFIESGWCNEELYIAYSLKVDQGKKLIPILLNISHNEMVNKYAILRSIKSINTKKQQVSSIAFEIATNRV